MTGRLLRPGRFAALMAAAIATAALLGAVAVAIMRAPQGSASPFADPDDRAAVERGAIVYAGHCATCHGSHLEGQENWQIVGGNGRLPAPPQDQRGHGWMHSRSEERRVGKEC